MIDEAADFLGLSFMFPMFIGNFVLLILKPAR